MASGSKFGVRRLRRAYSLTDVVIAVVVVAAIGAMFMPMSQFGAEQKRRVMCANNLRQMALAAMMYANQDVRAGSFPRTKYDFEAPTPTEYTGVAAVSPFRPDGPKPNDVSAAMYLILKTQDILPTAFVCPGSDAEPFKGSRDETSNFSSRQFVGYSYSNPYPGQAARNSGFKFNNSLGSDYPVIADMNSGSAALLTTPYNASRTQFKQVNSPNHRGDGQNVVYFDAHVEFQQTPYCGAPVIDRNSGVMAPARDNIYTAGAFNGSSGGRVVKGAPENKDDSVMLPTIADGFQPPAKGSSMDWDEPVFLLGIVGAVVLLVIVGVVLLLVFRKKKPVPAMAQAGYPPGVYPPGVYPPGAYPPGAFPPPGQYPPQYPPGQMPPPRQ